MSREPGAVHIQRQFIPLNRAAEIERALGPEMAEFYRRREEGLSRLEETRRKRIPVHVILGSLLLFSGSLTAYSLRHAASGSRYT